MTTALVLLGGAAIAYVNGANDVSKGIATLCGSGVTGYRRALLWGTLWTAAGGVAAAAVAGALVTTFGHGLLAPGATPTLGAALATIAGAAGWVLLATRTGLPVSTTHAIVGSLVGVTAFAHGLEGVHWGALGGRVALPLALSPLLALALTAALARRARPRTPAGAVDCVCAAVEPTVAVAATAGAHAAAVLAAPAAVRLSTGTASACAERPAALRLTLDHLHWLSSGATSFARGLNDAPKMAALILAAAALTGGRAVGHSGTFALVAVGMVAGSLVAGLRVTRVLAERVTPMDQREGLCANLVTAALVTAGAVGGLPMSTTHVAAGAIIGAGTQRAAGGVNRRTVRDMLLAWLVTVPAAAALGIASHLVLRSLLG